MSIRLRLAGVFALVSTVLFALGGWLFVSQLSASLQGTIDAQLAVQLAQAARVLPASGAPTTTTTGPAPGEYVVQVVDGHGQVRGGSADAGTSPLLGAGDLQRAARGR